MDRNFVGWFEIPVNDMERAVKFYNTIFNIKLTQMETGDLEMFSFPFVEGGYGAGGALVKHADFYTPSIDGILLYFATDNIDKVLQSVLQVGGKVLQERKQITSNTYMGLFLDSEGNRIALHSRD